MMDIQLKFYKCQFQHYNQLFQLIKKCFWWESKLAEFLQQAKRYKQSFSWIMGASAPPAYSPFNWLQTGPSTYINRSTNQTISFKQVPLSISNPIHSYKARLGLSHKNIVKLLHFSTAPNTSSTCSEDEAKLDVYIEGGLKKLVDFQGNVYNYNRSKDVRNGRTCFCGQVVSGFQALKLWIGGFQVSEGMVWVDIDGIVKVWGNIDPFCNNFVAAKQSLMVLQIKQILIKLQCKCNYSNSSNLTFDSLTKNNKAMHTHPPPQFQPSISNITSPKFSSNIKQKQINQTTLGSPNRSTHSNPSNNNIFYYPKNSMTDTKKLFSSVKYAASSNVRDHHLSHTQNIFQSRETVNRSGYQSNNEKKNRSTVVAVNKCLSPKVSFHYENTSNRGTPKKILTQFRPESPKSTITSPAQLLSPKIAPPHHILHQDHKPQPSQPTITRFQMYSEPYTFKTEKKIKKVQQEQQVELHIVEERSSLVSNNQNLMSPYEDLRSQKLVKMLSQPDRGMSFGVQGLTADDNLWDWGARDQGFSKGMIYQNSYTDRQGHSSHLDNSKIRESAGSQKLQQAITDIEYKIPQKTRLLIKKYLFEKSEQNPTENRQSKQRINNSFLKYKNEQERVGNTLDEVNKMKELQKQEMQIKQEKQKKQKNPLRVQLIRLLQDEDHNQRENPMNSGNPNKDPQPASPQKQAGSQEATKTDLNKKQKQILRNQMQKIFNFNTQDEQQSKIRKKVAEKKAIFADLKKQASKILDSHSQS